jgi:hypothetical protein
MWFTEYFKLTVGLPVQKRKKDPFKIVVLIDIVSYSPKNSEGDTQDEYYFHAY